MPFPDELRTDGVHVVPYRESWAEEGTELCARLRRLLPPALHVDHIGSTSVPGLAAKDCLDVMIRVDDAAGVDVGPLAAAGFRERPEEWNRNETLGGEVHPKRVFAPPVGGRSANVYVRTQESPTARFSLLFRDFLRASPEYAETWGRFKSRLAPQCLDLADYGQVKGTAQPLLMTLAEHWARETGWRPSGYPDPTVS